MFPSVPLADPSVCLDSPPTVLLVCLTPFTHPFGNHGAITLLCSGFSIPLVGLLLILRDTQAIRVHASQGALRRHIALHSGLAIPLNGLSFILLNTEPEEMP